MDIHTKTAFGAIKRSPFQAISAIFVLSLTFFVSTMMAILFYASGRALSYFETRPQIIAFLKNEATVETISVLQSKLSKDNRIKDLKLVSKEEALEIYKKATSDNPLLAELVSPAIFPASLEFSVVDLKLAEILIDEIKKEAIVEEVGFTANIGGTQTLNDSVNRLKTIGVYIRIAGIIFVGVLALTSFFVLLVIISQRLTMKKGEIEILSLIGARTSFIRKPIIIEALLYSLIGIFIGWILSVIILLYSSSSIFSYFGQIEVLPKDPLNFFTLLFEILIIELLIGILISVFGSFIAISRALKRN